MLPSLNKTDKSVPSIVMVTHVIPYPPGAGNEIRIYRMLSWFRLKGYAVTLVLKPLGNEEVPNQSLLGLCEIVDRLYLFDNRVSKEQIFSTTKQSLEKVDLDLDDSCLAEVQDGFCPSWFLENVAEIIGATLPDVVIAQYIFMSRILVLPESKSALKIIDAHDLFCRKQPTVEQYGIKNYSLSLTDDQERALLNRAEIVLAIQQAEKIEIEKLVPERQVLLTSFDHDIHYCRADRKVPGQVLIVASGNEFNVRGTQDFLDYTWPLIRERFRSAVLRIAGRVCQNVRSNDPTVTLLGFVENLDPEYEQAEVVVNPCRVGTGLKIKTIEALAWGKAHVAWPSATDGLRELRDVPVVIATDVVQFADSIIHLLSDSERRRKLEQSAHAFIEKHFAPESVYAELDSHIASRLNR